MNVQEQSVVVGVFHDRKDAQQAIRDLQEAGFQDDHIGVVTRHLNGEDGLTAEEVDRETNIAAGAGIGAAAGAGIGALWALGIATLGIPALGPVLVGGTILAAFLASTWSGGMIGSILGVLIGLGIPDDAARYYERQVQEGRTVVTVYAEGRTEEAWTILGRRGAYNLHREQELVATAADEPASV